MSREQAYMRMLNTAANIQWNVAQILEAKAVEAEKMRNWLINHVTSDVFADHESQVKHPIGIHEHVLETIEGLTKLSRGLTGVLKAVLGGEGDEGGQFSQFNLFDGKLDFGDQ
ncbi:MAG: restriction endonuclease subunit S [Thermobacillus sp. ZCTH02-B1]|uniref:restriction endonuclease subunit S n=1 Tax=Thermobacillus sp. ZCTH02-B1 TaxID=1858795 RepID=UPI000B575E1F|nr:restriction endonuclease subunit S [Thermobacillus sp. ZCTH02-B1]OUM95433.1 MAG: restriction endonuclease subunit S [Thermobacillus sp. ZCTH02-B1]